MAFSTWLLFIGYVLQKVGSSSRSTDEKIE